jgi:hypothetical protein
MKNLKLIAPFSSPSKSMVNFSINAKTAKMKREITIERMSFLEN